MKGDHPVIKISELQAKDVVNVQDGQKLGQIHDVEIDLKMGQIKAIVVPAENRLFGLFSGGKEWVIPWRQIVKIGTDVILVRLHSTTSSYEYYDNHSSSQPPFLPPSPED
ncbi:YlmC/YmxH family sporulation protein [Polycladomyces sp. WAk]|uniref:YlmC/YmxH family sporulation protein n=1 Tax=Polycladomyces zharkentensis TaxID=2807616 RepID=A0ABS2WFP1_9BACL|nr:YlmC/YmxH family sporulation protein [Polycladomyces sp. WAk]MBN2908353.1 YlmC/YmxH family sporulation protein [Polycladomyces sp. WAk]